MTRQIIAGDLKEVEASLRTYLCTRISGVGPARAALLVNQYGTQILRVLDEPDAAKRLKASGIGLKPHIVDDIIKNWDLNPKKRMRLPQKHSHEVFLAAFQQLSCI